MDHDDGIHTLCSNFAQWTPSLPRCQAMIPCRRTGGLLREGLNCPEQLFSWFCGVPAPDVYSTSAPDGRAGDAGSDSMPS